MEVPEHIDKVESLLRSTHSLLDNGYTPRQLRDWVLSGAAVRVARGWYVTAQAWQNWYPKHRYLAKVIAAHRNASTPPLFSHYSAAVLLNLPIWSLGKTRVHTVSGQSISSNRAVCRHQFEIPDAQQTNIAGYRCTTPQRTLLDLASCAEAETLIGCADGALREVAARRGPIRSVNQEAWERWLSEIEDLIGEVPASRRGLDRLRRAASLADPRAESVLESVSRLQLLRLGYEVELQVPVPAPGGGLYCMDFEMLGYDTFGECDGDWKYKDPKLLKGRKPGDLVVDEKKRDNWAMGTTNKRMAHWGARDVVTPERLAGVLRDFHIPLPRTGRWALK